VWQDADERPFGHAPKEYFSPFAWDAADQTFFRPVSRFFAVDPAGEALDVNALDEVPDSSWFENRIGRFPMTPLEAARGPCTGHDPPDPESEWLVKSGKPNGANPGFVVSVDGARYVIKPDQPLQGPRPSAADVIGSRVYHAAGYFVPCNRVVYLWRSKLHIDPKATVQNDQGTERPMAESDLDTIFRGSLRLRDGRYRAVASLYLEGKPLGPWRYQDVRDDDPNDVIAHQDRRELRGMRVLASWINHFDSREQNTLAMWIEGDGGLGTVRHDLVDFGEALGSLWVPPTLARRLGHSYYLDFDDIAEDWVTFGTIRRPWDAGTFGPSQAVFGYFDVARFQPEDWKPGYPNPAFGRMQEHDAAWMARIIAQFSDDHVRALVQTADLRDPLLESELFRILVGRRNRILSRYLGRLSPLTFPELRHGAQGAQLCMEDLLVTTGLARTQQRRYVLRQWRPPRTAPQNLGTVAAHSDGEVCATLPPLPVESTRRAYTMVDFIAHTAGSRQQPPARVHLDEDRGRYRIIGLERLEP
jgi:hypothetical protein